MITVEQVKAARQLLHWSAPDLAARAGIGRPSVWRAEQAGTGPIAGSDRTQQRILAAFAAAGVEFVNIGHATGVIRTRASKRKPKS